MSESHVVSGLKAKRAEIAGHIRELDKQAKAWRVRLSHIDASIKMFAPDADLTAIKPKRTRHKSYYFKHGEQTRMILDTLRERPGITATEIATALLTLKGVPTDPETVGEAKSRALLMLRTLKRAGRVTREGVAGVEPRWALAEIVNRD
jgi:hypothetical protein